MDFSSSSKRWEVTVGEDVIRIEDDTLYVNDKMQDIMFGISTADCMYGKLPNGKEVKVKIGAGGKLGMKMRCCIFVDCECVLED